MSLALLLTMGASSALFVQTADYEAKDAPQSSVEATRTSPEGRHSTVHFDVDSAGTHWTRGRTYKASVNGSGFAFVPFLGSDAPRNYPVELQLVQVTRAESRLELEQHALVTRTNERIVLDHGPVEVRYDFTPEGVEQSFAMDPPQGSDDLKLILAVKTELPVQPLDGGLRFFNELGGVTYSAAIAFDSTGRSVSVRAECSQGILSLTVPASFLQDAIGTVVIDPLINTFSVNQAPADLRAPDGAYSTSSSVYCMVAEEHFSGTDVDLFSWFVSPSGDVSNGAYADQTSQSWEKPSIAALHDFLEFFVIVAEAESVAFPGKREVAARDRYLASGFQSPYVLRSATSTYSCVAPEIGADNIPQGFGHRVVYLRDYGAYHGLYTFFNLNPLDVALASSSTHDVSDPSISKQTGVNLDLVAAWSSREIATGASSVEASLLHLSQGLVNGTFTVAPPSTDAFYFDVATSLVNAERYYLIAYDDRPSNLSDAFVALGRGSQIHDTVELQMAENSDRTPNQDNVRVATTASEFWAGYVEDGDLRLTSIQPVGNKIGVVTRRRLVVGSDVTTGSLAALQNMNGNPGQRGVFVWSQASATTEEILGGFSPSSAGGLIAGTNYCYGTPNSTGDHGFIQVFGNRLSGTAHTLRVEALPPTAFGYYLCSMTTALISGAGGSQGNLCVGGSIGRFGIFQAAASGTSAHILDTAQIPQPTGAVPALAGQTWSFQSWFRDSVGGTATSNFTNAVTIEFV